MAHNHGPLRFKQHPRHSLPYPLSWMERLTQLAIRLMLGGVSLFFIIVLILKAAFNCDLIPLCK